MWRVYWIFIFIGLNRFVSGDPDDKNFTVFRNGTEKYAGDRKQHVSNIHNGRRQRIDLSQFMQVKTAAAKGEVGPKRGKHYDPSLGFEPYWADGDWTFKWFYDMLAKNLSSSFCDIKCSQVYTRYGVICGRNKRFQSETFDDYCALMQKECDAKEDWYMAYRGKCLAPLYPQISPIPEYQQY